MIPVDTQDERPSKSQRKREMHALQDLGQALLGLPAKQLAKLELPDALRLALAEAKQITAREAKRRQMQYIGKLMRGVDPQPLAAAVAAAAGDSATEAARLHRIERLRDRLLDDDAALSNIAADHPGADIGRLRELRDSARSERKLGSPPRAFRALFRMLRDLEALEAERIEDAG